MQNCFGNEFNNVFNNSTITNIYQDIKNNRTINIDENTYYIKKSLRESDVLVISIGMEELANNYNKYNSSSNTIYLNKIYLDIINLINEIKKYAYSKVIFFGYYNPTNYYDSSVDDIFYDINNKLKKLMDDNSIIYVDLYELVKRGNINENKVYCDEQGKSIIKKIINFHLGSNKIVL